MKNVIKQLIISFIAFTLSFNGFAQDTLKPAAKDTLIFSGQLSSWGLYNHVNTLPVYLGVRYIPTLDYIINLQNDRKFDFETSVNIYGTLGFHPFDKTHVDGSLMPYRVWARYSTKQLEIRLGLQKINFGSASLLRPLMWFDQIDPRDPLQLTNGVWGLLGRYYFMNNANLWLWYLYGNDKPRPWDVDKTNQKYPELGGRFQSPVPKGEIGITIHHRIADTQGLGNGIPVYSAIAENRIGLDGKWDLGVGLWFEGTLVNKTKNLGMFTNQEILNLGIDNTFSIGNGLTVVAEQLLLSYDKRAFEFSNSIPFSGLSLSYPISMIDNLSTISYYDWTNKTLYNFMTLKRQFNKISFYLMAFWNPKNYQLPQQENSANFYSGKGIQFMLVFNH
jgi:hypothetical protein